MANSLNPRITESVGLEARDAMNAVFDALSAWRDEVAASTERCSELVLDKMAPAARAMGWPKEIVEASRAQLVQASKMQMHMIDQLMDAWQQQLKSPIPSQFMAQLRPFSGIGFGPTTEMSGSAIGPAQFWMQAAEMWQRNWASALSMCAGQAPGMMGPGDRGTRSSRPH